MRISQWIDGIPKGQPRPRAFARKMGGKFVARVYDAGTAECWKSDIAAGIKDKLPESALTGPLRLTLTFYLPRPKSHYKKSGQLRDDAPELCEKKPDWDNLGKSTADALTALGMWRDDSQIVNATVEKFYGNKPGCLIVVETIE